MFRTPVFLVALFIIAGQTSAPVSADDKQPGIEETVKFIQGKLDTFPPNEVSANQWSYRYREQKLKRTKILNEKDALAFIVTYRETAEYRVNRVYSEERTYAEILVVTRGVARVYAAESTSFSPTIWYVQVDCVPNSKCLTWNYRRSGTSTGHRITPSTEEFPQTVILLRLETEDAAVRAAKALTHLVALGGGGRPIEELF